MFQKVLPGENWESCTNQKGIWGTQKRRGFLEVVPSLFFPSPCVVSTKQGKVFLSPFQGGFIMEQNGSLFCSLTYRKTLERSIIHIPTLNMIGYRLDLLVMIFLHCYMEQNLNFHNYWYPQLDFVVSFILNIEQRRMKTSWKYCLIHCLLWEDIQICLRHTVQL